MEGRCDACVCTVYTERSTGYLCTDSRTMQSKAKLATDSLENCSTVLFQQQGTLHKSNFLTVLISYLIFLKR